QERVAPMGDKDRAETVAGPGAELVRLPLQPGLDELRTLQIEIISTNFIARIDIHLHRAHKIGALQRLFEHAYVPGQPQVVVVLMKDDVAFGLPQHMVAIELAARRRLWKIEKADTRLRAL